MKRRELPVRHLFGVPIHALRMDQAIEIVDETITSGRQLLIGVVNAAKMVNMRHDALLRDSVLHADLILADGMGVVWASRLLRRCLPERVPGIDLMLHMLHLSERRGYGVFCLGATADVLEKSIAEMRRRYPKLNVAGYHHGYFTEQDEQGIAEQIKASGADILLVAMTSPKKERFLARWSQEIDVPICHGVGGSFDVLAGKVKRAPESWQKLGLEWLYRVLQEPRRMWRRYLVTNALFCMMTMRELFRRGGAGPESSTRDCPT